MALDDKLHSGRDEYHRDSEKSNIRNNFFKVLDDRGYSEQRASIIKKKTNKERDTLKILLVVYDNGSYMTWFPQGLGYVAAVMIQEGYEVEVYNQDLHHYPDEHLTHYLDNNHYDAICLSLIHISEPTRPY